MKKIITSANLLRLLHGIVLHLLEFSTWIGSVNILSKSAFNRRKLATYPIAFRRSRLVTWLF